MLTAAHCIHQGDSYKLVEAGPDRQPVFKDVAAIATHPQFNLKTMLAHRVTADVALMKLKTRHNGYIAPLLPPRPRVAVGERFVVRGYGAGSHSQCGARRLSSPNVGNRRGVSDHQLGLAGRRSISPTASRSRRIRSN